MLPAEYAKVAQADRKRREGQTNMTLAIDGWSNAAMHSIYGVTLRFSDGSTQLLKLEDLSSEIHTAVNIAGNHMY